MSQPNPFPQVGTPSARRILPVGYDRELIEIRELITQNVGRQPILINLIGEFGQGKTTIIEYLMDMLSKSEAEGGWGNLTIVEKDLTGIPDLEMMLSEANREYEESTRGILLILDEGQRIVDDEISKRMDEGAVELTKAQEEFLNKLRDFTDGRIEGLDIQKFVICFAIHPETNYLFFKGSGRLDVSERTRTKTFNLRGVDYYSAYEIIKRYLETEGYLLDDIFDESVIYSLFTLLSWIEEQSTGSAKRSGRTLVQVFFNLFELTRNFGRKISQEDIKRILADKNPELRFGGAVVSLKNSDMYVNRKAELEGIEKELWDYLVFHPNWHIESDLPDRFKDVINNFEHVSSREGVLIKCDKYDDFVNSLNKDIQGKFKGLERERIYYDDSCTFLIFTDTADEDIKDHIYGILELANVYRLSDEYLETIFQFKPDVESIFANDVKDYLNVDASARLHNIYKIVKKELNLRETSCKHGTHYKYLIGEYGVLQGVDYKIALFFHPYQYSENMNEYLETVKIEISNSDVDFGIIILDPYTAEETQFCDSSNIRKMENRLFIEKIKKQSLGKIFQRDVSDIEKIIEDSIKVFAQEAVSKGFTIPFMGLQEKVKNKKEYLWRLVKEDIIRSIKCESQRRFEGKTTRYQSAVINGFKIEDDKVDGVDGQLSNLARETVSEFMEFDEDGHIIYPRISKYEKNFLELFGEKEVPVNEFNKTMDQYFAKYSRIKPVYDFLYQLLDTRKLVKIEGKNISLIEPSDLLKNAEGLIERINESKHLLSEAEQIRISNYQHEIECYLQKDFSDIDWAEKSIYNSRISAIIERSEEFFPGPDDPLVQEIKGLYQDVNQSFEQEVGGVKVSDLNIPQFELEIAKQLHTDETKESVESISQKIRNLLITPNHVGFIRPMLKVVKNELEKYKSTVQENHQRLSDAHGRLQDVLQIYKGWNLYEDAIREIDKFKRTGRYNYFLNDACITFPGIVNAADELDRFKAIVTHDLNLFEQYVTFLERYSEQDSLTKLQEVSDEIRDFLTRKNIIMSETKSGDYILKYLRLITAMQENEYIIHQIDLLKESSAPFSEDQLIKYLEKIGYKSNPTHKVNNLFEEGFLVRRRVVNEFYSNGELKTSDQVEYSIKHGNGESDG